MIAYLSDGIEHVNYNGEKWRKQLVVWLNIKLNHNMIDLVIESNELILENNVKDFRDWKKTDSDRFIQLIRLVIIKDLDAVVNKVDYIICLWDTSILNGGGTHGEITISYYYKKPTYLINNLPIMQLSGWIISCSLEISDDSDALKNTLHEKFYNANNRS